MLAEFYVQAEKLKDKYPELDDLISAIREYLIDHFENLGRSYEAQSILESRFTPPEIAFNIGMNTCGTKTNIAAEMLRYIGYEVKKVHGSVPESRDHAWISVKDPKINFWKQYDLTRPKCEVTPKHEVIKTCNNWEDIKKEIQEAFLTESKDI